MEGITEIDKTKYIDECKEIVRNEIPEELSDEMLTIVTNEIMDTCLFIGGDFKKENIIDITKQYVTMGGIRRTRKHMRVFKMQHYCEIPTPKGTLRGFFHKPNQDKHPVCLIFHGFTGQKTGTKFSYVQLSRMLEAKGIASFRFDFLGSGESDGNFVDMTFQDELSCARVILEECLKMENCTEIYVLGHSMGGAIASELAKLYPDVIKKMVLWAPAFNLPDALHYLTGQVERAKTYDHGGYEISDDFVEDILKRDFYQELDTYQNDLLVIHGTKDTTVPYEISNKYMKLFHKGTKFISIEDGNHNFDKLSDIKQVLKLTLDFFE